MIKFRLRRGYLKPLTISKLVPNLFTLSGLAIGLTSFKLALESRWELAVSCIIIAAFIDGIDGRIARILNATSRFGAELDSLCDFVNFGVSPAILIYLWSLRDFNKSMSWLVVLLFVVCIAIRLARFNTDLIGNSKMKLSKHFFRGIPSPIAALLAVMPIILDFEITEQLSTQMVDYKIAVIVYLAVIGVLSASRFPTFSVKYLKINPEYIWVCLWSFALLIVALLLYPWYLFPMLGLVYIATIPLSIYMSRQIN